MPYLLLYLLLYLLHCPTIPRVTIVSGLPLPSLAGGAAAAGAAAAAGVVAATIT